MHTLPPASRWIRRADMQFKAASTGDTGPYNPGDTPTFRLTIKNKGPGSATGMSVHVDLPGQFKFKTTTSITGDGARTEAVDPRVGDQTPAWGLWALGAPTRD